MERICQLTASLGPSKFGSATGTICISELLICVLYVGPLAIAIYFRRCNVKFRNQFTNITILKHSKTLISSANSKNWVYLLILAVIYQSTMQLGTKK